MGILKKKSEENFNAIDLLLSSGLNAPVVHCAYYSCLQLIIDFVYKYVDLTDEEIETGTKSEGSHNFFLTQVTQEIKVHDSTSALVFYKFFSNFKRKRTEADYHKIDISQVDSLESKTKAEKIRKFLNYIDNGEFKNIHLI